MVNKILITGGAGFIGINAADQFIKSNWQVTILDNLSKEGSKFNLEWLDSIATGKFKFIKADIASDRKILAEEIRKNDVVLHLAGQVAVTISVLDPYDDFKTNTVGTLNILESIRNSKGKKPILIYASTNKIYGNLSDLKIEEKSLRYRFKNISKGIDEKRQLDFHSPYGCSKGAADQYVRDYSRIYGLRTVVLRQSCVYGRHQFGIKDEGWVAWFLIAAILKKPIVVYGTGKQVRDALFVDDLVGLYFKLISKISIASGNAYNVGGGYKNSTSLLELFNRLKNRYGLETKYGYQNARLGDQKIFISNNSKLYNDVGWKPKTDLNHGLDELYNWIKDNLPLIKSFY